MSRTSITPVGRSWASLPATVLVDDLERVSRALRELPPALVRPRVEAEAVRVVRIGEVRRIGYDPGAQRLDAEVVDAPAATAEAAHRGVDHLPDSTRTRLADAATALRRTGLTTAAHHLDALAAAPDPDTRPAAQLRLLTAAELR
ncbi:hypothetical protein AB0I60_20720 [Actinosynnema sp. NPDC050436]|uniref:hypothetical protein n=1 Tax=Actinosynnema sp. NPDC050436 TaxID=3155659 RepID=UPI0033F4D1F4